MFDRFDPAARRVLFLSKFHASAAGDAQIEPLDPLAGILREQNVTTWDILRTLNVDTEALKLECGVTAPLPSRPAHDPVPSERTRRILASAAMEADEIRSPAVVPSCLLLAILREPDNSAARLLERHGVAYDSVLEVLRRGLGGA